LWYNPVEVGEVDRRRTVVRGSLVEGLGSPCCTDPADACEETAMKRTGMSLIELLVVIAIIGVLIALLLPAVQMVREAANRASCRNNLEQMGRALHNYHDTWGSFPVGMSVKGTSNLEMGGFCGFVSLLPFLEQDNLFNSWDLNANWYDPPDAALVSTEVKVFYCPSNRSRGVLDMSFLVAFAGRPLPNLAASDYLLCKGANAALCEKTQVPPAGRGVFDVNTHTRLTDITDGTSTTFAIGEGAGNNPRFGIRHYWADTTPAQNLFPGQSPFIDQSWSSGPTATQALHSIGLLQGACLGVTALRGGYSPPFDEPMNNPLALPAIDCNNGCTNSGTQPGAYDTISGFRSAHSGGCNFLFCDGSVRFVTDAVSAATYRALSTMAGSDIPSDY
jgi:prepilin-type processing-associated H-X9-DG protein/prepilin-type N-terminal cleavage/methylation domain-containing protein